MAERLRGDAWNSAPVGDLLAASWHMLRVIDEVTSSGGSQRPRLAEVDLARLCGRLVRLAEPRAESAGVVLTASLDACAGLSVMADEGALWGIIETMLDAALECASTDENITLEAKALSNGALELVVALDDSVEAPVLGGAVLTAEENGLHLRAGSDGKLPIRLIIPRGRLIAV